MIAILYRWRIKSGFEQQFIESWSEITKLYLNNFGALGSRLHQGGDGSWYAYAQWKSAEDREAAFENNIKIPAIKQMKEAIEESFPELLLNVKADFLLLK